MNIDIVHNSMMKTARVVTPSVVRSRDLQRAEPKKKLRARSNPAVDLMNTIAKLKAPALLGMVLSSYVGGPYSSPVFNGTFIGTSGPILDALKK